LSFATSLISDPAGFVFASSLAAVAIILAATAMRIHTQRLALPAVTEFDGQVIARWIEKVGEDDTEIQCIAVDDGSRARSFEIKGGTFSRAAGVRVRVRLAPRTRKLLDLTVQAPPAMPAAVTPAWPPDGSPPSADSRIPDSRIPDSWPPDSRLPAQARHGGRPGRGADGQDHAGRGREQQSSRSGQSWATRRAGATRCRPARRSPRAGIITVFGGLTRACPQDTRSPSPRPAVISR
jgi:hypothetical protein